MHDNEEHKTHEHPAPAAQDSNTHNIKEIKEVRVKRNWLLIFVVGFALIGGAAAIATYAAKPEKNEYKGFRGEVAIEALGNRLPAVAAKNSIAPERLKELFLTDPTIELGPNDELMYVEPGISEEELNTQQSVNIKATSARDTDTSQEVAGAYTTDQAFNLSSYPASDKTIYLDFDGHVTQGTSWNDAYGQTITSTPFDTDGSPSTYSDAERQIIIDIWSSVSENFAPYFINVTTKDPGVEAIRRSGSSDSAFGSRVVISPTYTWYGDGAGGVAYTNSFGNAADTPVFVFSYLLKNGSRTLGEASSHEAGHALGLGHDGTSSATYYKGSSTWAPIMGNSYYAITTQWSKGEYTGANNKQDDLAVMLSKVPLNADEAGENTGTAAPLTTVNGTYSQSGVIAKTGDTDTYAFNWQGGPINFMIKSPAEVSTFASLTMVANLDPSVRLLNSSGTDVQSSDPAGTAAAALSADLPAGTYYLEVKGVGYLDPASSGYSNYASLGRYVITSSGGGGNVVVNQPPIAKATATPTSGIAPLTVALSSSGSSDPEGKALTYSWNLGNGTTSTSANPSVTYTDPGVYTVSLTVTDASGLSSTVNTSVTVQSTTRTMTIASILGSKSTSGKQRYATVEVTILSSTGTPVSGVTVSGNWSGIISGSSSAITGSDGKVFIRSKAIRKSGTATFTVTNVTSGSAVLNYVWDGVQKQTSIVF